MAKRPAAAAPSDDEPEDTFPTGSDVEAMEEGLPPLPDATETIPESDVDGATGEAEQQDAQFRSGLRRKAEKAEADDAAATFGELVQRYATGYWRVERIGPTDLPRSEIGDLGKVKCRDLETNADVADVVSGMHGGGEYRLTLFGARGKAVPTVPEIVIEVAGDIKPRSRDGHAYLNRKTPGDAMQDTSGLTAMVGVLRDTLQRPAAEPKKDAGELLQLLAAVTGPQMTMMQALLAQQNSTKDRELAEIKAKSERELAEIKAKTEREERESREKLAREEIASKERIEAAKADAAARLAEATAGRKYEFLGQKVAVDAQLRQLELKAAGPLGVEGNRAVQKKVVEAAIKEAMAGAGLGGEKESGMSDFLRGFAEQHGDRIFDLLGQLFPAKAPPARPAGPPAAHPAATPQRALPDPAPAQALAPAAPGEANAEVDVLDAPAAAPEAPADALPPSATPDERDAVRAAGMIRVNQFLDAVAKEMKLDGDPAAAWDEAVDDNPRHDVAWLYSRLPSVPREALASSGWPGLRSVLDPVACEAAIGYYDRILSGPSGDWWTAFLEAGPWTEDDTEE